MTSSSRERTLARQKAARQAMKEAEAAERRRRFLIVGGGLLAAALVIVGGAFTINSVASDDTTPAAASDPLASAPPLNCTKVSNLQTTAQQFPNGPETIVLSEGTLGLNLTTNCGPIQVELDSKGAPKNSSALIFLANTGVPIPKVPGDPKSGTKDVVGYFDNTACHRLTTEGIFVVQCGDPTAKGTGTPGFSTPDENLPGDFADAGQGRVIYPRGTVAMANSGPDTNGSQFFIVYKDSPLAPNYVVVGRVTQGQQIIDGIAREGVAGGSGDGPPSEPLVITKVLSYETRPIDTP